MEPAELLTKRRIEKLASEYEHHVDLESVAHGEGQEYDVFVSHSSHDA